jgi:NADH:ubiquinone oxidoreductase subunit 3 (subunit A)
MDNSYFMYLIIIQIYLALRYAIKAVMGNVDNYNILKLAMVLFIPIIGYYLATKKEMPVS